MGKQASLDIFVEKRSTFNERNNNKQNDDGSDLETMMAKSY